MSSWRNEYLAALQARDRQEQTSREFYGAYTKLADRTAILSGLQQSTLNEPGGDGKQDPAISPVPGTSTTATALVRQDLVDAQRSRSELQARLDATANELEKLQLKSNLETQQISELAAERSGLVRKMRDRIEELRGKTKLVEDVHDENLSLTIELNMAEAQNKKLQAENKELVDRWMARKGAEADAMNTASNFS